METARLLFVNDLFDNLNVKGGPLWVSNTREVGGLSLEKQSRDDAVMIFREETGWINSYTAEQRLSPRTERFFFQNLDCERLSKGAHLSDN